MVDTNFQKAVDTKKIADIRDFLRMRLTLDHNCVSGMFIECRKYCFTHGITELDLYQAFDGRPLPSANTEENFTTLLGQLSTNFAKKRIERLLEIGQAVWPEEQGDNQQIKQSNTESEQTVNKTANDADGRRIISVASIDGAAQYNAAEPQESDSSGRRKISETPILDRPHNGSTYNSNRHNTSGSHSYDNKTRRSHNSASTMNKTALIAGAAVVAIIVIAAIAFGCSK